MSRERAISRGQRYVAGLTFVQIAAEDGFRQAGGVAEEIRHLSYHAARHVTPNSELPAGLEWWQVLPERNIWTILHRGRTTRDQIRWALKVLKDAEPPVCECCGRPL